MRRTYLLLLAAVLVAVLIGWAVGLFQTRPAAQPTQPSSTRPNVLLISLDTLRPDHLGCYGYAKKISPQLDAFAAQGVRFGNCRAQAPWTLPSHMALFTSMLPAH